MSKLSNLKASLEELPAIRKGRTHKANYAQYLVKVGSAKEKLLKVSVALPLASSVLPSPDYVEAGKRIDHAAKTAKRLVEMIMTNPEAIGDKTTESDVISLTTSAESSLTSCKKGWEGQLEKKTKVWEDLATVVSKLGGTNGAGSIKSSAQKLSKSLNTLKAAASRLPETGRDTLIVKSGLEELSDSVSSLNLETPFGKFLKAASSSQGAELESLQHKDVLEAIEKHSLQKVFRVFIS